MFMVVMFYGYYGYWFGYSSYYHYHYYGMAQVAGSSAFRPPTALDVEVMLLLGGRKSLKHTLSSYFG